MIRYRYIFSYADLSLDEYQKLYNSVFDICYDGIFLNPKNKTAVFHVENKEDLSSIHFPDSCQLQLMNL